MDVIHDTEQSTDPKTSSNAISFTSTEDLKKSQSLPTDKPIIRAEDLVFKIVKTEVDASAILFEALSVLNELEGELLGIEHSVKNWGEDVVFQKISKRLFSLQNLRKELQEPDETLLKAEFQKKILPLTMQSEFCNYAYSKPRGYAGDFDAMERIWNGRTNSSFYRYLGTSELGKLINAFTFDMENCKANEFRVHKLKSILMERSFQKVALIGSGSAIEIREFLKVRPNITTTFYLFDQDFGALEKAKSSISLDSNQLILCSGNVLRTISRAEDDSFDLIYSSGLFDYFSLQSSQKLFSKLWQKLRAGGMVCVTNANANNPTRLWMEYVTDWYLSYKTVQEMLQIIGTHQDFNKVYLEKDPFGVYQYLSSFKE